ncbi:RidA family protein [Wukongibacter baidiensis]|uniref:RidA family protein n=1 Tax=Wukongibacter baidiensis TaxID=1723361 RepID=UPI003D7F5294
MDIENRIKALGIELQPCPKPAAIYIPYVVSDNYIFISGQTPKNGKELVFAGKVGRDISIEEGYKAAELCGIRLLSVIKEAAGSLSNVKKIVSMTGYVNANEEFEQHSQVINGASELIEKIFGDKGKHSRAAIGVSSLPGNASVEISLIVEI